MTRAIPPVRRLLMDAQALIAREENWCKDSYARNDKGEKVDLFAPSAVKLCPIGALRRIEEGSEIAIYSTKAFGVLCEALPAGWMRLSRFNDAPDTIHPMIMALFNKAIKRAKEQGI